MEVNYVKNKNANANDRVEFLLINFDYYDGNDYIAKLFCSELNMVSDEKTDYIYFTIIHVYNEEIKYELLWHEDTGNAIYCVEQSETNNMQLEKDIIIIIDKLNKKLNVCKG